MNVTAKTIDNQLYACYLMEIIKSKRLESKLTQNEFSKIVNISPITYGHLESGRSILNLFQFVIFCKYLNLNCETLLNQCAIKLQNSKLEHIK